MAFALKRFQDVGLNWRPSGTEGMAGAPCRPPFSSEGGLCTHDKQMRTLIYKRTHTGDPDPKTGVFGNNDCMGSSVSGNSMRSSALEG